MCVTLRKDRIMMGVGIGEVGDGDRCVVDRGTHAGKSGVVQDCHTSKTGHVTITVAQADGVRFKTLGKNVSKLV
jgi:ribosomal protein S4E